MSESAPGLGSSPSPAALGALPGGRTVGAGSGALLNTAHFTVAILVSFFLSPYMLRRLGSASYGLLSVTWEMGGYFGLLDLGLRSAINYHVAKSAASSNTGELREVIRTAFWLLSALTLVALVLSGPLAWFAARYIDKGPLDAALVHNVLWVGLVVFALNLTGSLSGAVLGGLRRFDLSVAAGITGTIGAGLVVFGAIEAGLGLLAIACAQGFGTMLPWIMQQWILHRRRLTAGLWPPRIRRDVMRRLMSYGGANLAMRLSELFTFHTDQILIVMAAGPASVAQYHIGRFLALHSRSLINAISMVLTPYFTALSVSGSKQEIREFFLRLNCWINSLALLLLAGVLCLGQPFLRLWVGESFTTGEWWSRSDVVLALFAVGMAFRSLSAVSFQYLLGNRRLQVLTTAMAVESAVVLAGGAMAVRWRGIAAVALVKLVTSFLLSFAVLIPYSLRGAQIGAWEYVRLSLAPALLVGAATAAASTLMALWLTPQTWASFSLAAASGAAAGALVFFAAAGPKDREFIRRKLRNPLG